jgi:MFS family permease
MTSLSVQTPIMMISALSGLRFIQRWGRRRTLMISSTGMAISVVLITVCTALTPTHPGAGPAGIVFLYVFLVVFAFVWTPMQALYPCEVLAYNNRAKGLALLGFMNNVAGFFNTCAYAGHFHWMCAEASVQMFRRWQSAMPAGSSTCSTPAGTHWALW